MSCIRFYLAATILAAVISSGAAIAQTSPSSAAPKAAPAATTAESSKPSKAEQVETWTNKQWDAAKKKWAKDKAKWTNCQKQSDKQKLEGRKSWSFLSTCMTT